MPDHDLVALWEAHCRYEFETRDVDATMATMVAEPYVNHVPTMTGGVGHDQLRRFYKHHFIGGNPPDTELVPVSRTVGADQIVDEVVFKFTHTSEIDWMLPGVKPTGRRVEIPLIAIVRFVNGKVAHEHIYWDQAWPHSWCRLASSSPAACRWPAPRPRARSSTTRSRATNS
jgi:carboxymethylenebutenolidase